MSKFVIDSVDLLTGGERLRSFISITQKELRSMSTFPSIEAQFAVERQITRTPKKCLVDNAQLPMKALSDFKRINEIVKDVTIDLTCDEISNARSFIEHALEKFTSNLTGDIQNTLNLSLLLSLWKYGPGSSRGTKATHFADKILVRKPTVTMKAKPLARLLRLMNPHLSAFDGETGCEFKVVTGSSISTVPKNEETHRTICTEPLMNMALQLGAGVYIERALRTVGLDIRSQAELNFILADIGSKHKDLATLDLKSASDLISPRLIELLWPRPWYDLLMTIRSESTLISGEEVSLNMMSTMGNGFTFPMMTLTLLALVYSNQSKEDSKPFFINYCNTGVFGDDIIIPTSEYSSMVSILSRAGLIVNTDKSYSTGYFRESCGGDFYRGYNVTPFYVKELRNDAQVYVAINSLVDWCASHEIWLYNTLFYLMSLLHKPEKPFFTPVWSDPTTGIRSSRVSSRYKELLVIKVPVVRLVDKIDPNALTLMITGGYVNSAGDQGKHIMYNRKHRQEDDDPIEYYISDARLPKGFLDGRDSVVRCPEKNDKVERFLTLALS